MTLSTIFGLVVASDVIAYRDLQQRQQHEVYRFLTTRDGEGDALANRLQDGNEALSLLARVYHHIVAQDNVEVQVRVFIPVAARQRAKKRECQHARIAGIVRCERAKGSLMAQMFLVVMFRPLSLLSTTQQDVASHPLRDAVGR